MRRIGFGGMRQMNRKMKQDDRLPNYIRQDVDVLYAEPNMTHTLLRE